MRDKCDKYNDAFGEAVYGAWKSGLDSDMVDRDRGNESVDDGLDAFEAAEEEIRYLKKLHGGRCENDTINSLAIQALSDKIDLCIAQLEAANEGTSWREFRRNVVGTKA